MSLRLALLFAGLVAVGALLVLADIPWFSRRPLAERLRPHNAGRGGPTVGAVRRTGAMSTASFRDVVAPLAQSLGTSLARLLGVREPLAVRLERVHAGVDAATFRTRQAAWVAVGLFGGLAATAVVQPPFAAGVLGILGAPFLAFLVVEQRLANRSAAWQRRITLELPVVSEQLAMLLSSGYSLGAGLNRLAQRGSGACAADLARVCSRIRQGLSEHDALEEWATLAGVPALDRLVTVLALNRQATDLGRLVTQEARTIRRELHRDLVALMERRGQQVWIPVTVATLVPGVLFLSIPFIEALRQFAGS